MSSMSHSQSRSAQDLVFDVANTTDGAFAVNLRQSIMSWNAAAEELLGYTQKEVLGRTCGSILGICGRPRSDCDTERCYALANTIRGRLTPRTEVEVRTRAGDLRRLSMGVLTAHSSSGEMCVVHVFHDITGKRRSQAEVSSEPVVGRFPPPVGLEPGLYDSGKGQASLQLTHREHEVLRLLAAGLTTSDIAANLSISPITVRNHVTKVIEKLEVRTRLQAVVAASRLGLI
ncbi:MAG: LuxR C-terminal-related transcriptional regulator [Ktedonobacterales bacterium]